MTNVVALVSFFHVLVGVGQGLVKVTGGFAFDFRKAKMIVLSVPFLLKGLKGRKENIEAAGGKTA